MSMISRIIANIPVLLLPKDQTSNRPLENSQAAAQWRTSRAANTFAALLIIEMLMNCIFNQINGAFRNFLSLYISDNDNNTTFVGSHYLFVALTTRATNKQYALQKSHYCLIIQTEVNVICQRLRWITLTKVWIILDIMRKPNPTIVLLYIQNSHTKMQAKCGSKKSHAINHAKLFYFVIFARFEVMTSSASNNFFLDTSVQ